MTAVYFLSGVTPLYRLLRGYLVKVHFVGALMKWSIFEMIAVYFLFGVTPLYRLLRGYLVKVHFVGALMKSSIFEMTTVYFLFGVTPLYRLLGGYLVKVRFALHLDQIPRNLVFFFSFQKGKILVGEKRENVGVYACSLRSLTLLPS
jgi:hypothetical protein